MIKDTVEYKLISAHYGDKVAKRSQARVAGLCLIFGAVHGDF